MSVSKCLTQNQVRDIWGDFLSHNALFVFFFCLADLLFVYYDFQFCDFYGSCVCVSLLMNTFSPAFSLIKKFKFDHFFFLSGREKRHREVWMIWEEMREGKP